MKVSKVMSNNRRTKDKDYQVRILSRGILKQIKPKEIYYRIRASKVIKERKEVSSKN
jgi:hypothetical protein